MILHRIQGVFLSTTLDSGFRKTSLNELKNSSKLGYWIIIMFLYVLNINAPSASQGAAERPSNIFVQLTGIFSWTVSEIR